MKRPYILLMLALAAAGSEVCRAEIEIRLSVKFILGPGGVAPTNSGNIDLSTSTAFNAEVAYGNSVLAATGRAYRFRVVEYLNISPPVPAGQPANYWYNLAARSNRQTMETASINDPGSWRRNLNGAINIYVNNSSSGSCSFIASGDSIALGSTIFTQGTVLHEIGHFFDLSHTHGGDCCTVFNAVTCPTPFVIPATTAGLMAIISDGDGLVETLPDHGCLDTLDQLSRANFGVNYSALTPTQSVALDNTFYNVMSYHTEQRFLEIQMDFWAANANMARHSVCSGYSWFVATNGVDFFNDGLSPGQSWQSVGWALAHVTSPNDVILMQTGTYASPENITTPCTLTAKYGPVVLSR